MVLNYTQVSKICQLTNIKNCNKYFVAGNVAPLFGDRLYTKEKTCKQFVLRALLLITKDDALFKHEKVYQVTYHRL